MVRLLSVLDRKRRVTDRDERYVSKQCSAGTVRRLKPIPPLTGKKAYLAFYVDGLPIKRWNNPDPQLSGPLSPSIVAHGFSITSLSKLGPLPPLVASMIVFAPLMSVTGVWMSDNHVTFQSPVIVN